MGKLSRKAVVTEIVSENDSLPPILVNFENSNIDNSHAGNLSFRIQRNTSTKERFVSTTCENVAYRGICKSGHIRKFLAIRNKATNEVKLVEAAIGILAPVYRESKATESEMTSEQLKGALAKAYGTKKRRLNAILSETLKVDSEAVKTAATNVDIVKEENPQKGESVYDILPAHNREATVIEDVYKLEAIIVPNIVNCFQSEVDRIMNTSMEELKNDGFSDFFYAAWSILQHKTIEGKKKSFLQSLLYIECVSALLHLSPPMLKKPDVDVCYFSKALNSHILDLFTLRSVSGRIMPNAQKDKAISYVLLLCFLLFDYKVEISLIVKLTRSSLTRLKLLSRVIGATVNKDNLAFLRLPLSAPPTPRQRNKK
ncbi:hypothetical protein J437_LFUL000106 [Ladona fulva]|uniref:DNA-directed RNA polymerase I subunit RPA49 n=1 Tax=Ladona fulva TaxID=123851 RepID=A0A8K0K5X1_LADFU|nr:hypothetical protein J437_LFUL000106 [Ladona fulva]